MANGRNNGGFTLGDLATPEKIQEQFNVLEQLQASVSTDDDYLAAMLQSQRIMLMHMMQQSPVRSTPPGDEARRPFFRQNLPIDSVGIANRRINENDSGRATFQIQGTIFAAEVKATEDVASGDPIVVTGPENEVENINDVARSLLGFAGGIGVDSFEVTETDENVTIQPGERETVLRVNVAEADIISVGTNDETHSLYHYTVDNAPLNDDPLKEPLGLYNDMYQFPTPIAADREFRVEVERQSSASGTAEYFSKVAYFQ